MYVYYSSYYYADIGKGHIFPIKKFEFVRDRLLKEGTVCPSDLREPEPATLSEVLLVHTEDYISRLLSGKLTVREVRRLGLPWSHSLVRRSFFAVGGTISASRTAIEEGVGSNLAGGTHHAFANHGEGFCVLNDVAIAIQSLRRDGLITKAAIVDCDVHQGNGTATIFADDPDVLTFSMHATKNYPLFKAQSSIDVELPDGVSDETYLETLRSYLPAIFKGDPEAIFYLAGADPFAGDKLGRLALSKEGLAERDYLVLSECFERKIPVITVMSGGYGKDIQDTVEVHCNTIRMVRRVFQPLTKDRVELVG